MEKRKELRFLLLLRQKVYLASSEILKRVFGFDDNGLSIGIVEHHNLEARLNVTRLFKKHLAILGISGSGKSHLSSVLIEEIAFERKLSCNDSY